MKFNDRELLRVAESTPVIEGPLQYLKPQGSDYSDWYMQQAFKKRVFKLINNLLFYYRIGEMKEPLGVLVLENMQVAYETPGPAFAFSLMFSDGKHVFACRCQEDLNKWVSALKCSSYEYWKSQYTILQTKINMRNGKDPVLGYIKNIESNEQQICVKRMSKSTFYSRTEQTVVTTTTTKNNTIVPVDNLIDL